tara:strand:- start:662 stop:904 length:243 start_codon:yes stop_codon:yes gene_type:complete
MALPKKRTPTSKKRSRRSHHKFSVKSLMNSFDYKIKKLDSLNRDDEGKPFTLPSSNDASELAGSATDSAPEEESEEKSED